MATWSVQQPQPHVVQLVIAGPLQLAHLGPLWRASTALLNQHPRCRIEVLLGEVSAIDGAGLAWLHHLQQHPRPPDAELVLQQLAPPWAQQLCDLTPSSAQPSANPSSNLPEQLGQRAHEHLQQVQQALDFFGAVLWAGPSLLWRRPRRLVRDTLALAEQHGARALPIVTLIAFLMGVILAFQSAVPMQQFGAEVFVANLVGLSMLRELAPLMTAILLAGRTGAAFAAELGTMKVNEEINALHTLGQDPIHTLVFPRVFAVLLMAPLLTVYANLVGLLGGALVMLSFNVPVVTFWIQVKGVAHMQDFLGGELKAWVFGGLVALIGCFTGMQTGFGAQAVGAATTRAVVLGIVAIVLADGLFAVMFYHLGV